MRSAKSTDFKDGLIGSAEVRRLLGGISAVTLWRRWNFTKGFPRPLKAADGERTRNYFDRAAVLAWIASRANSTSSVARPALATKRKN